MRFLALSIEPDQELVERAARRLDLSMQVAIAKSEALGPFGVNQVPSIAFLKADGTLNAVGSGYHDKKWLERRLGEIAE